MARTKTLTKANLAQNKRLGDALDRAMRDVFAVMAPRNDVPFSQCLDAAPDSVRDAYDLAYQNLLAWECEMVSQGRGWRDDRYHFRAY